jgi:hypothetical protein
MALFSDRAKLEAMPAHEFMGVVGEGVRGNL